MFPENVLKIANELEKAFPNKVGFVGGCLRDIVLNKPISDYDIYVVGKTERQVSTRLGLSFRKSSVIRTVGYNENYEPDKYNEHFKGVFNITTATGEEVDIILTDSVEGYVQQFPCSISQIAMSMFNKRISFFSTDFTRAIDKKEVVWYRNTCKDNVLPFKYYKKIQKKYSNYLHIME